MKGERRWAHLTDGFHDREWLFVIGGRRWTVKNTDCPPFGQIRTMDDIIVTIKVCNAYCDDYCSNVISSNNAENMSKSEAIKVRLAKSHAEQSGNERETLLE